MEIMLGKTAGFCFGITNAVEKAEKLLKESNEKIFCLGELTHNPKVMDKLKDMGLIVIEQIEDLKENSKVIFRAHGMPKEAYQVVKEKKSELFDFTCPTVLNMHEEVKNIADEGKYIFLLGEKKHPEIIGTKSFAHGRISVIENEDEIENAIEELKKTGIKEVKILAQTTFNSKKFDAIIKKIKEKIDKGIKTHVHKTICSATENRQKETRKIAKKVEFMIIIGGKNSSNTTKLYDISKAETDSIHITSYEELEEIDFNKFKKVGVMAGASTPKESIEDVINYIKNYSSENKKVMVESRV